MTTSTITARRKGYPQHDVKGKINPEPWLQRVCVSSCIFISCQILVLITKSFSLSSSSDGQRTDDDDGTDEGTDGRTGDDDGDDGTDTTGRTDGRYILFQSFRYDIGTNILMSKCYEHKTTVPDTRRHFRLAIEISRIFPIVCGCLQQSQQVTSFILVSVRYVWPIY